MKKNNRCHKIGFIVILLLVVGYESVAVAADPPTTLTWNPGSGYTIHFPEQQASARVLGYIQSTYNFYGAHENGAVSNKFNVRRASLDLIFRYGLSLYHSNHKSQTLKLVGHSFSAFSEVQVTGRRYGILADSDWYSGNWHTRGELFLIRFSEPLSDVHQTGWFYGSYSELGYMLQGDDRNGHQLIGRLEAGQIFDSHPDLQGVSHLYSVLAGHNWYAGDGLFRFQSNIVYHLADRPSTLAGSRFENHRGTFEILFMMQLRI